MESFSTIDIFDTKGIEYLFIIGYLFLLIAFWRFAIKPVRITSQIKKVIGILTESVLQIPQGLFYSKNHTWTHMEPSGVANVGLDDLLHHITGDIKFHKLIEPGGEIHKGELLTEIYHQGKMLKISAPISGQIIQVNPLLNDNQLIGSEDTYGKFWVYKIKPNNWIAETSSYYFADDATTWINKELSRFKDFLAKSIPKHSPQTSLFALQDGGELRDNTLSELPDGVWTDFQQDFLNDI
ncbi:MAG: hypothetical protein HN352_11900 [Bacteroidetes bacterium]|jgi:glycine cleavage system H protein|nr:hypothetical protein [Bacteroidota bacterium]MBT3747719.1 hypothetical protein [Bacteroidota bacterium]MBT4399640.1 hypothetical protein [Bacteroidota bacterium]MBT4409726.1 hypothetical protein [Bacteroidota bacterium]MBT7093938.1 hypothetical protein [Bacteroidota bacterium]